MNIADNVIKEIEEKADIEEIISSYVKLSRNGKTLKGLCPFHKEKTPSFTVTPDKELFYCFGCHKGGSVFTFVMEMEKLNFVEAVQFLAKKTGVNINFEESDSYNSSEEAKFKKQLLDLYEKIANSFHYILVEKKNTVNALSYFEERGVSKESIEKFKLGYIPQERNWLYKFLKKKSYSDEFLKKTALFSEKYKEISIFSGRVMFPIFSKSGGIIAFGGRVLDNSLPKYINSPETIIFKKNLELYGLNFAQKEIRKNDCAYIVEGYMDVIAMVQAGVENCVAPLGTAFTENHAGIIKRNCSRVILVFDGDAAGLKAAEKSSFIAEKIGLECSVVVLKNGKDPAEILKKDGAEILKNNLKYPINCFNFLLDKYKNSYDLKKEEGIKGFLESLFNFVSIQDSEVRRSLRLEQIAEAVNSQYIHVYNDFLKYEKKDKSRYQSIEPSTEDENNKNLYKKDLTRRLPIELYLMLAIIENYDYFYMIRQEFSVDDIKDRDARKIYIILEELYRNDDFSEINLIEKIDDLSLKDLVASKLGSKEFSVNAKELIEDTINMVKLENLNKQRREVEKLIKKDDGSDFNRFKKLLSDKQFFDNEIQNLKGKGNSVRST